MSNQEIIYDSKAVTESETEEEYHRRMGIQKNRAARKYRIGPYFSEQA